MEEILKWIGAIGFPASLCTYVVVRLEPIVRENTLVTKENNALVRELKILVQSINGRRRD